MASLTILAASMALIVQPLNGGMYVVDNLAPDTCAEAAFIAENGKTRARFEAEMSQWLKAHPKETSYSSQSYASAYCIAHHEDTNSDNSNTVTNGNEAIPPKKKAPAGCGTILACGGYDDK